MLFSLLVLVVLSIATISAIQTSGLQERIAGNTRDRSTAFNAAESGLRDAESYLATELNLPLFDGSVAGHYSLNTYPGLSLTRVPTGTSADATSVSVWKDPAMVTYIKTNGIAYGAKTGVAALPDVLVQPRYMIEMMPSDSSRAITYRITSLASGRDSSLVVLQNYYTPPQTTAIVF